MKCLSVLLHGSNKGVCLQCFIGKERGYNSTGNKGANYAVCIKHNSSRHKHKVMSLNNKWHVSDVILNRMACHCKKFV